MKKKLNFLIVFCFMTSALLAQRTITGSVVFDDDNSSLPGVTVIEKGTNNGTVTNVDGDFSINVSKKTATLVFSYIGMETQEISLNGRTVVNVTMKEDVYTLDELVAVGYGTMRKSDITGSVTQVKLDDLEQRIAGSAEQLLQGSSGVLVRTASGAPGSGVDVQIRGGNSLSSSFSPLYVIDGIEMNEAGAFYSSGGSQVEQTPGPSPLSFINPSDIQSMEILKDASATAIYGSRGANGVVIITTKSGVKGRNRITYDGSVSISQIPEKINVLDSKTWMKYYDESLVNDGEEPLFGNPDLNSSYDGFKKDINWQDEFYRTAVSNTHNLTFSGADDKTNYAFIINYQDNNGIVVESFMKRASIRSNLNREVNKWLSIGSNIHFSNTDSRQIQQSNRSSLGLYSPVSQAIQYHPADYQWGDMDFDEIAGSDGLAQLNPIIQVKDMNDKLNVKMTQGKFYGDIIITDWLKFRSSLSFNLSRSLRKRHWPLSTLFGKQYNGRIRRDEFFNHDYNFENYFSFNKEFGKSRLHGVLGTSAHDWTRESIINEGSGFILDVLGSESFGPAEVINKPQAGNVKYALSSFYGRFNYSLKDKYLLTFTGRYDGSSKLGKGNEWSFFPSGALAWRITEEEFMKSLDVISNLKLRTSYGITGSQSVAPFQTMSTMYTDNYPINNQVTTGFLVGGLANPNLKWEKTSQFNVGLDIGLFRNRINIVADYYIKNTSDMLFAIPLPTSTGFSSWIKNAGEVENKGWEFSVDAHLIEKANFSWSAGINLSGNKSKVIEMVDGINQLYGARIGIDGSINDSPNLTRVGESIGQFYGYKTSGVYQNESETENAPLFNNKSPKPGDIIIVDQPTVEILDENGSITGYEKNGNIGMEDKVILGNPEPDLVFGLNTSVSYKGFDLNLLFNGMIGNDVLNANLNVIEGLGTLKKFNQTVRAYEGRWTGEGTSNYYPRATNSSVGYDLILDRFVEDGSFLRLQSVTLSYNLKLKNNSIINNIKPYITGSNLFVITNYSGYDPEVQGIPSDPLSPGIDLGTYPLPRTFKLGVNLTF